ncbi:hypothetical protein Pcinc_006944 [Petrolisthes cinctipes]|uniref:Uncharacterized protein n=1 Tax=Petrolisthes cinctipes TaxID=88211 RepID=A0AAE1GC86_PETCI|nr:hypothetical protein Pcinc_006944 [Petrolisthes cinctipes]
MPTFVYRGGHPFFTFVLQPLLYNQLLPRPPLPHTDHTPASPPWPLLDRSPASSPRPLSNLSSTTPQRPSCDISSASSPAPRLDHSPASPPRLQPDSTPASPHRPCADPAQAPLSPLPRPTSYTTPSASEDRQEPAPSQDSFVTWSGM